MEGIHCLHNVLFTTAKSNSDRNVVYPVLLSILQCLSRSTKLLCTLDASMPGVWSDRIRARTGWPGASILQPGKTASLT